MGKRSAFINFKDSQLFATKTDDTEKIFNDLKKLLFPPPIGSISSSEYQVNDAIKKS